MRAEEARGRRQEHVACRARSCVKDRALCAGRAGIAAPGRALTKFGGAGDEAREDVRRHRLRRVADAERDDVGVRVGGEVRAPPPPNLGE